MQQLAKWYHARYPDHGRGPPVVFVLPEQCLDKAATERVVLSLAAARRSMDPQLQVPTILVVVQSGGGSMGTFGRTGAGTTAGEQGPMNLPFRPSVLRQCVLLAGEHGRMVPALVPESGILGGGGVMPMSIHPAADSVVQDLIIAMEGRPGALQCTAPQDAAMALLDAHASRPALRPLAPLLLHFWAVPSSSNGNGSNGSRSIVVGEGNHGLEAKHQDRKNHRNSRHHESSMDTRSDVHSVLEGALERWSLEIARRVVGSDTGLRALLALPSVRASLVDPLPGSVNGVDIDVEGGAPAGDTDGTGSRDTMGERGTEKGGFLEGGSARGARLTSLALGAKRQRSRPSGGSRGTGKKDNKDLHRERDTRRMDKSDDVVNEEGCENENDDEQEHDDEGEGTPIKRRRTGKRDVTKSLQVWFGTLEETMEEGHGTVAGSGSGRTARRRGEGSTGEAMIEAVARKTKTLAMELLQLQEACDPQPGGAPASSSSLITGRCRLPQGGICRFSLPPLDKSMNVVTRATALPRDLPIQVQGTRESLSLRVASWVHGHAVCRWTAPSIRECIRMATAVGQGTPDNSGGSMWSVSRCACALEAGEGDARDVKALLELTKGMRLALQYAHRWPGQVAQCGLEPIRHLSDDLCELSECIQLLGSLVQDAEAVPAAVAGSSRASMRSNDEDDEDDEDNEDDEDEEEEERAISTRRHKKKKKNGYTKGQKQLGSKPRQRPRDTPTAGTDPLPGVVGRLADWLRGAASRYLVKGPMSLPLHEVLVLPSSIAGSVLDAVVGTNESGVARHEILHPAECLGQQRGPVHVLWPDMSVLGALVERGGRFASSRQLLREFGDAVTGRSRAGALHAGASEAPPPENKAVVARFGRALEGLRLQGVVRGAGRGGKAKRVLGRGSVCLDTGVGGWVGGSGGKEVSNGRVTRSKRRR